MTSSFSRWETVKAKRRVIDPGFDDPERLAQARAESNAYEIGYHLAEMRAAAARSVADVAAAMGVDSSAVEKMEDGEVSAMQVDAIAAYIAALGGHLQLVANVGETVTTVIEYGPRDGTARDVA